MIKLLLWILIIYFISRFIRRIINAFMLQNNTRSRSDHDVHGSGVYSNGQQAQAKNHYNINQKDIVDAKFEEIKPEEKDKSEEKDNPDKD